MSDEVIRPVEPSTATRILVGIDGSDDALRAAQYARGTAERTGSDVWLVHALDDAVLTGGWGVVYDPTLLTQVGEEALAAARRALVDQGFPTDRIHCEVLMGHPTAVLADLSENAELIVVGRRAQSGVERMFVGSTSVSLAGLAHCPVIVISAASTPEPTGRHQRIAVAVSEPDRSRHQLVWALDEARARHSALMVALIAPPPPTGLRAAFSKPHDPGKAVKAKAALETLLADLRHDYPDVPIEGEVLGGVPVQQLIGHTGSIDLLVVGVHAHPVTGVTFSGPLRAVLAHSLCPVSLVR